MAANNDTIGKTLLVAFLVCLICAVVVSTAAVVLRPVQEKNRVLDRQMNILMAAGLYESGMDVATAFNLIDRRFVDVRTGDYVEMPDSYDSRKAAKVNEEDVSRRLTEDPASIRRQALVKEVYLARNDHGEVDKIILPIHGSGLWSTLYGFLALEPDGATVAGLGFYEHGETPGLGGEVDNPRWKAIWQGKKLFDEQGSVAIQVIKGNVDESTPDHEHKVDGLAGASLTSKGVNNLVRFWVSEAGFGPYLKRVQGGLSTQALN